MAARPRLHEAAALAGVSEATVSRVLNGKMGVADRTRTRVLKAVRELGYAEPVRRENSDLVGIITPEIDNPVFASLAQLIDSRLALYGIMSMVCVATSETVHEQDYIDRLVDLGAAGIVIVTGRYSDLTQDRSIYQPLVDAHMPLVMVNGITNNPPAPAIAVDESSGAEMAVHHLHSFGHRKIGLLVGPSRFVSSVTKTAGYTSAIEHLLGEIDPSLIIETLFTAEGGQAAAAALIERGVTGIVAGSDLMALGAIRAVRYAGLAVPDDISVIGFDGTSMATFTDPPLTTLRQPLERMAAAVANSLIDQRGRTADHATAPRVHFFAPELVVGRSSGPAPVSPPH